MAVISLADKINLKNKFLDKINKNINQVNNSLVLLNNFNHKMNRQYGGELTPSYIEIHEAIDGNKSKVTQLVDSTRSQIVEIDKTTENTLKQLIEAQKLLADVNINNQGTTLDKSNIPQQLKRIIDSIKPKQTP